MKRGQTDSASPSGINLSGALMEAINNFDVSLVRVLIKAATREDLNRPAGRGRATFPLHQACFLGNFDIIRLLLDHGADVNRRDKDGSTPLHKTCSGDINWVNEAMRINEDIIRFLIENGIDLDVQNALGRTALHNAGKNRLLPICRILLEAGADATIKDCSSASVLDYIINDEDTPDNDPDREWIIDWYREHHPEMVMEKFCTMRTGRSLPDPT